MAHCIEPFMELKLFKMGFIVPIMRHKADG